MEIIIQTTTVKNISHDKSPLNEFDEAHSTMKNSSKLQIWELVDLPGVAQSSDNEHKYT